MNKYENEQFKVDEFSKVEEYQRFKAEDFKSLELLSVKKEEFKVDEIQKQSFVNEQESIKQDTRKKDNKVFDKLKNKIMSSSSATSASVSTAIGSTGALITAGIVGAGVVLSPVLDLPIFQESDYGSVELINYCVDSDGSTKTVTIYFDEQINDEYKCYIVNDLTQESKLLDTSLDEVTFENLIENEYNFELVIKDVNDKVIDSKELLINTVGSIFYTNNHDYEWLVTYNNDNTFNAYYYPTYDYANNQVELNVSILDSSGNKIKSNNKVVDNVYYFEDIAYTDFTLMTKAYLIENNNKFLIHNELINYISPDSINYDISANEQEVNLIIQENISSDINVTITYLDDNKVEKYSYLKDTWTGSINIPLTNKTEKVKVGIETSSAYDSSANTNFIDYKGSINKSYVIEEELFTNVQSTINLEKIEILNEMFSNYDGQIPTILYFDGYMIKDSYYMVNVYDASNQIVAKTDNLTALNIPVALYGLPTDQILTIEYLVFDNNNNQLFKNSYQTSVEIKEEYLNAANDIYAEYENPGSITRSFNEDGTINYYFYTSFENNTNYDAKARISLCKEGSLVDAITNYTSDKVMAFENVPIDQSYGLIFNVAIKDDIKYYVINDGTIPSGTLNEDRQEDGIYYTYLDVNETDTFKQYEVDLTKTPYSDLLLQVLLDTGETLEYTILQSEIVENRFMLDLSAYDFISAEINVKGLLDMSNSKERILQEITSLKGNVYIDTLAVASIYLDPGYASYLHHNVESKEAFDENYNEYVINKDIYIYIDSYTSSFFNIKVINTNDNSSLILDEELGYVVFTDLLEGTYNFEIQIIDGNEKVYDKSTITINTESNIQYTSEPEFDSLITYNEDDNTYNYYYYPKFDYTNNTIESTYILKDQYGNELDRVVNQNLGGSFERVNSSSFQLEFKSYLLDNDNTYLIANTKTQLFELDNIPYEINRISENQVSILFGNELTSDLIIDVIYKDDSSSEKFIFTKEEWTGSSIITLSKLSIDIEINVSASLVIYNQNFDNNIDYYMGSESKTYTSSETLSFNIDVRANLERVEILNDTYSYDGTIPTNLVFNGYMKPEQTLTVNVYDSSNSLINSVSGINNINKLVTFTDLITTEEVTFEYIIYDKDNITEVYKNTYQTSLEIPSEYTTDGISYLSINPSDASLTFNDDGTYNAYFMVNLENTSTYDAYMRIELIEGLGEIDPIVSYGNNNVILLEDINPARDFTLGYGLTIKDGINYYAINSQTVPSGSLYPAMYSEGKYEIYCAPTEISTGVYDFEFVQEITSDVTITILLDETTTETVIVPISGITDNVVRVDMNQYSYETANITIYGDIILQYNADLNSKVDNIIGVNECEFICTYTI